MGLNIDIVYAKIQTIVILTQNVYPNVFVGGFGFPIELCDKKKGLYPLAFLSMAIFHILLIISLWAMHFGAWHAFLLNSTVSESSPISTTINFLGFPMGPSMKTRISLWKHEIVCLMMGKYKDPFISQLESKNKTLKYRFHNFLESFPFFC